MALVNRTKAVENCDFDKAEIELRYQERKKQLDASYFAKKELDDLKAKVRAEVKYRGPIKWAYDIIAMHDQGLYNDLYGLERARKAIKLRETYSDPV